jgi:hypothetical protein
MPAELTAGFEFQEQEAPHSLVAEPIMSERLAIEYLSP